jgi:hypothetical protein
MGIPEILPRLIAQGMLLLLGSPSFAIVSLVVVIE